MYLRQKNKKAKSNQPRRAFNCMRLIKLIRHLFSRKKKLADAIAEAVAEGIKEAFKEMEYPFAERD